MGINNLMYFALLLLVFTDLFAENKNYQDFTFEFIYDSANVIVGDDSVGVFNGSIVNISSNEISFSVVRRINVNLDGWSSSICIGSVCYSDWVDSVSVNIESGDTINIGVLVWTNGIGSNSLQLDLFNNLNSANNILFDLNIFTNQYVDIKKELYSSNSDLLIKTYPNPFNPVTQINYYIKEDENIIIDIFDSKGRNIKSLLNDKKSAGHHSIRWNAKNDYGGLVPTGIYFLVIKLDKKMKSKKMIYMK